MRSNAIWKPLPRASRLASERLSCLARAVSPGRHLDASTDGDDLRPNVPSDAAANPWHHGRGTGACHAPLQPWCGHSRRHPRRRGGPPYPACPPGRRPERCGSGTTFPSRSWADGARANTPVRPYQPCRRGQITPPRRPSRFQPASVTQPGTSSPGRPGNACTSAKSRPYRFGTRNGRSARGSRTGPPARWDW